MRSSTVTLEPGAGKLVKWSVIGSAALFVLAMASCNMSTTIGSGEAGVRYSTFGGTDLKRVYGEGTNLHPPWVEVYTYDVRVQESLEDISVLASNGLAIGMDASIRWRPVTEQLPQLHTEYGTEYFKKLVQPVLRSSAREVVSKYTPEELYSTKRTALQQEIVERVREGVQGQYVRIEAVLIRDVKLPEQIQKAIERKLQEEQEAERYRFTLEKERLEAERKQIEANGEAEYQRILTATLTPQFLKFKGVEATEKLAASPNAKVVIVGGGEDGLPVILGDQ